MKTVAISGGFDPLHIGHLRYIQAAAKLGQVLVIVNDDDFLIKKKGYYCFTLEERMEILMGIKGVYAVCGHHSEDGTVIEALRKYQPDIFAKGGDRVPGNVPEEAICRELGIEIIYGVGGSDKPNSSSWVIERILKERSERG